MKFYYSEKCLSYHAPGHPESPERLRSTVELLRTKGFRFDAPVPCTEEDLLRVHDPLLIQSVRDVTFSDPDTPALPGIFEHALLAAGSAICAMRSAASGETSFSLMRPPGHHATRSRVMGFCYFNSMAVGSARFLADHPEKKLAILDIDCHHGNGTEDIFLGREGILYVSLHQSPLYPGTGIDSAMNCLNFPLPPFTEEVRYLETLKSACGKVREFHPDIIGVSAGFDTYENDPLAQLKLKASTYKKLGASIAGLNRPLFIVMEGGYAENLSSCVFQFIQGIQNNPESNRFCSISTFVRPAPPP
jgi:acetoin utilization deacetylase AcuC-like enzyme